MNTSLPLSRLFAVIGLVAAFGLMAGCDSSGNMQSNDPPNATATVSTSAPIQVGDQVQLDGSGSSDPNGDNLSYNWTLSGPSQSTASLQNPSDPQPTFTPDVAGDYTASLEVDDGSATATDQVTVTAQSASSETAELGSNVTSDRTLTSDTSYVVTANVCIQDASTLTIEAGTELRFEAGQSLRVCGDGSALDANGTGSEPILMAATTGNESQGYWQGVKINSSNPNNSIEYAQIRHAGSDPMAGSKTSIWVDKGGELTLQNSTIEMSGGHGIHVQNDPPTDASTTLSLSSNTYRDNSGAALSIPFQNASDVSGSSTFGADAYVRVKNGPNPSTGDHTLNALDGDRPYRFEANVGIDGDASVTIEAGTEMEFESGANLTVNSGDAALIASGTSDDRVTMTATPGNENQGWWQGIGIFSDNPNNALKYVDIKHAGSSALRGAAAAITVGKPGDLTMENSTITQSGGHGLFVENNPPVNAPTALTLASNTYENNAKAALALPFRNASDVDGASTFGSDSYVKIKGGPNPSTGTHTIDSLRGDTPYRVTTGAGVDNEAQVEIVGGTEMEFAAGARLNVNSTDASLIADGTANNKIRLIPTPGNETAGHWNGVGVYSGNADNEFSHVIIRYASRNEFWIGGSTAAVGVWHDGQLTLQNSTIANSEQHGVVCEYDPPSDARGSLSRSGNTFNNVPGQNVKDCN